MLGVLGSAPAESGWSVRAQFNPRVVWNGREFLLTWTADFWMGCCCFTCPQQNRFFARLVDASGVPMGETVSVPETTSIVATTDGFLAALASPKAITQKINTDGARIRLEPQQLVFESPLQVETQLASGGGRYYAIWWTNLGGARVGARSIDENGAAVGPVRGWFAESLSAVRGAVSMSGDAIVLVADRINADPYGRATRLKARAFRQIAPMPPAPLAPLTQSAARAGDRLHVKWTDRSNDERGFVIEARTERGYVPIGSAPQDAEEIEIRESNDQRALAVRVRAWNANGFSDGDDVNVIAARRRSARR